MARIIINSDDFGVSFEVNRAIIKSFEMKLISSTSTLMNYDESTLDAIRIAKENRISSGSVGIHLNLTTGKPLTEKIKNDTFFCENGSFNARIRNKPIFFLNRSRKQLVYEELSAQVEKFITNFGHLPSHIDSHHHVHTEWAMVGMIINLCKKYKIKNIRISRNCGSSISIYKKIYKLILNFRIVMNLNCTNYFGDINDMETKEFKPNKTYEIMVHALLLDNDVVDYDQVNLKSKFSRLLSNRKYNLINYGDL